MHTFHLKPLVIKNKNCIKTKVGTLVDNGINELDAVVTCFKELLPEAINYRCGTKDKISLNTEVELVDGEIIVKASFDVLEKLGDDAEDFFEIPELLNHFLHSIQEEIFVPFEQGRYNDVHINLKKHAFGKNIKKIVSQVAASKDVLDAAGVLQVDDKDITLEKFVVIEYGVDNGEGKLTRTASVDIFTVDVNKKNAFTFQVFNTKEKLTMSAGPKDIIEISKWTIKDKPFYANVEFEYLTHLKYSYCKCNLIKMTLMEKKDVVEQQECSECEA